MDKHFGRPCIHRSMDLSFGEEVANQEDANKMFEEELEFPGAWLISRCDDTADNFVYKVRAQSRKLVHQAISCTSSSYAKGEPQRRVELVYDESSPVGAQVGSR